MARELNLDENSEMRRFTIEVKAIEGRRFRRDLLARVRRLATTYTWEVSFDAVKSLTSTGAEDADAWMENLATTITAGGFSVALSEDIGVTLHVDQDSISYYVITRSPTPAPSVLDGRRIGGVGSFMGSSFWNFFFTLVRSLSCIIQYEDWLFEDAKDL